MKTATPAKYDLCSCNVVTGTEITVIQINKDNFEQYRVNLLNVFYQD